MKIKYLRLPAFLLSVLIIFSLFLNLNISESHGSDYSFVAKAVTYIGNCGEDCKWTLNLKLGKLEIEGSGKTASYEYKSSPWYKYRDEIEYVTVGSGIKSLGENIFAGLNKVKKVTLPSTIKKINDRAFYGCESLLSVDISNNSKIKSVGSYAFAYCRKLRQIPAMPLLEKIGSHAFFYCYGLDEIALGYPVSYIGESAFGGCRNLEKIRIVNFNCDIHDSEDTLFRETKIEGFKSSTAKAYADKYNHKFSRIKDINYLNDLKPILEYSSVSYNGQKKMPSVRIKGLKKGKDYSVSYKNNVEPGTAKVIISPCGDTLGEKTVSFKINPPVVKNIGIQTRKNNSLTINWNKSHGADKYEVYILSNGNYKKVGETKKTHFSIENLSSGKEYSFKIRAVANIGKKSFKSKMSSSFTAFTRPDRTEITGLNVVRGGGKLKVSVKKVSGASGYEIFLSTKENGKYKAVGDITSSKLFVILDNLNNTDTYYIKARTYIVKNGSRIYSPFCEIRSSGVL